MLDVDIRLIRLFTISTMQTIMVIPVISCFFVCVSVEGCDGWYAARNASMWWGIVKMKGRAVMMPCLGSLWWSREGLNLYAVSIATTCSPS